MLKKKKGKKTLSRFYYFIFLLKTGSCKTVFFSLFFSILPGFCVIVQVFRVVLKEFCVLVDLATHVLDEEVRRAGEVCAERGHFKVQEEIGTKTTEGDLSRQRAGESRLRYRRSRNVYTQYFLRKRVLHSSRVLLSILLPGVCVIGRPPRVKDHHRMTNRGRKPRGGAGAVGDRRRKGRPRTRKRRDSCGRSVASEKPSCTFSEIP